MSEITRAAVEAAALIAALQADALAVVATAPMDALRFVMLASELRRIAVFDRQAGDRRGANR